MELSWLKRGIPNSRLVYGKSQPKMDDDWGYPHDLGNLQILENNMTQDLDQDL